MIKMEVSIIERQMKNGHSIEKLGRNIEKILSRKRDIKIKRTAFPNNKWVEKINTLFSVHLGHESLGHHRVDDLFFCIGSLVDGNIHLKIEGGLEEELELVEPHPQIVVAVAALHEHVLEEDGPAFDQALVGRSLNIPKLPVLHEVWSLWMLNGLNK